MTDSLILRKKLEEEEEDKQIFCYTTLQCINPDWIDRTKFVYIFTIRTKRKRKRAKTKSCECVRVCVRMYMCECAAWMRCVNIVFHSSSMPFRHFSGTVCVAPSNCQSLNFSRFDCWWICVAWSNNYFELNRWLNRLKQNKKIGFFPVFRGIWDYTDFCAVFASDPYWNSSGGET